MQNQIEHYEKKLAYEIDSSDLYDAISNHKAPIIIDARKPHAYNHEHIPFAINLPHRNMDEVTTSHFDKSKWYVVYCDGIGCNASTKGALNMTKLGFNVRELMGGIDWWKRDGYATEGENKTNGLKVECAC